MSNKLNELYFTEQMAVRKGRSKSPCILKAGITLDDNKKIVLRAVDKSGTASLVALLGPEEALALAKGLQTSVEQLRKF